jgi:hypothetical protein
MGSLRVVVKLVLKMLTVAIHVFEELQVLVLLLVWVESRHEVVTMLVVISHFVVLTVVGSVLAVVSVEETWVVELTSVLVLEVPADVVLLVLVVLLVVVGVVHVPVVVVLTKGVVFVIIVVVDAVIAVTAAII